MGLSGRNAMVTGGASGIGRAICLRLARDGADVAVLDLDQGGGRQVADEVAALHRRAVAVEADVANAASVAAAVERLDAKSVVYGKRVDLGGCRSGELQEDG